MNPKRPNTLNLGEHAWTRHRRDHAAQKRTQRNVRCRSAELHRRSLRSLPPLSSLCALVHHIERPSPPSPPPSSFTAASALLSPLPIRCVPTRNMSPQIPKCPSRFSRPSDLRLVTRVSSDQSQSTPPAHPERSRNSQCPIWACKVLDGAACEVGRRGRGRVE